VPSITRRPSSALLAVAAAAVLAGLLSPMPARTAPRPPPPYTCIALGTLGGDWSTAAGVNDLGEVVGYSSFISGSRTGNRDERAFYWKDRDGDNVSDSGEMVFLGSFGHNSVALSINNLGEAVGFSKYSNNHPIDRRAVLWNPRADPPTMTDLNTLLSPADQGVWTLESANQINHNRQVVGYGMRTTDPAESLLTHERPFLLDLATTPPTLTDLGTLPGGSETHHWAQGLNNLSPPQAVGFAYGNSAVDAGFLFDFGLGAPLSLSPLSRAHGVNDAGQVVGTVNGHPGYWKDSNGDGVVDGAEVIDIGTLGQPTARGAASAINDLGLVVGNTGGAKAEMGYTLQRAFKWQAGTPVSSKQDLNGLTSAPFVLRHALDVSDTGRIVGYGNKNTTADPSTTDKAYLLKPNN
jgi:probable HAF family extracellular repeat protein